MTVYRVEVKLMAKGSGRTQRGNTCYETTDIDEATWAYLTAFASATTALEDETWEQHREALGGVDTTYSDETIGPREQRVATRKELGR